MNSERTKFLQFGYEMLNIRIIVPPNPLILNFVFLVVFLTFSSLNKKLC